MVTEKIKAKRKRNELKRKNRWQKLNGIKAYYQNKGYKNGLKENRSLITIINNKHILEKKDLKDQHKKELRDLKRKTDRSEYDMEAVKKKSAKDRVEWQRMIKFTLDTLTSMQAIEKSRREKLNDLLRLAQELVRKDGKLDDVVTEINDYLKK